ncbi:DNA primase, partial [Escherichia coli]|nr:DNA primase [Escherichia coli]
GTVPLTDPSAEPARLYLRSRGILAWDRPELSRYVRFHPELTYKDKAGKRSKHPGIVCTLIDPEGQAVTINRHYLTMKGEKADLAEPKKMFPIPSNRKLPGCAVPTSHPGEVLDVCEGLETALSVETAMGIPVWPLVNSYLLESFVPPACTKAVRIWADKDRKEGGQKAALTLKKRLWEMGIKAQIMLPDMPIPDGSKGVDWNDVLRERGSLGFLGHEVYRAQR